MAALVGVVLAAPVPPLPVREGFRWHRLDHLAEVTEVLPGGRCRVRLSSPDAPGAVQLPSTTAEWDLAGVWADALWIRHHHAPGNWRNAAAVAVAAGAAATAAHYWGDDFRLDPPDNPDWPILPRSVRPGDVP